MGVSPDRVIGRIRREGGCSNVKGVKSGGVFGC